MSNLLFLPIAALLTGTLGAVAEDAKDYPQPVHFGAVTNDPEKDTQAYDPKNPTDLDIRFTRKCAIGEADIIRFASATEDDRLQPMVIGTVTNDPEKNTEAYDFHTISQIYCPTGR